VMPTAKAKNIPKILNNRNLKAGDFQKKNIEKWLEERLEEL